MATKKPMKKSAPKASLSSSEISFLKDMIKYKKMEEKMDMAEEKMKAKMMKGGK
jgi:hypothetical protein